MTDSVLEHFLRFSGKEAYTITQEQYEALCALPPGVYLVCSRCHKPQANGSVHFNGIETYCDICGGGR